MGRRRVRLRVPLGLGSEDKLGWDESESENEREVRVRMGVSGWTQGREMGFSRGDVIIYLGEGIQLLLAALLRCRKLRRDLQVQ
jgi:hypothetical protein